MNCKSNIIDNKLYHGSPYDLDKIKLINKNESNGIFVSPFKGIASCFVIDDNFIVKQLEEQLDGHITGLSIGFNQWNKSIDKLIDVPDNILITLNLPNFKSFEGVATGFIYTIDYQKYKDKCKFLNNKDYDSSREFIIETNSVSYVKKQLVKIKYKVQSSDIRIKKYGCAKLIPNCLYTYITTPETVDKDGILSPIMTTRDKLQHYAERVGSWKTSNIIKWLEQSFKGRSKSISVLTEKIPSDVKRIDLKKLLLNSNLYQLPSLKELQKLGLVEKVYISQPDSEKFTSVENIDYLNKINWSIDKTKKEFTGIIYYQLVLTKGYIPAKYCKKISEYDPPYSTKQIEELYGKDSKLLKDPIHKWRAETGIELIHKEPTLDEQIRTWINWQNMTDEQKSISDKKSKEFHHGLINKEVFNCIMMDYDKDHKIINNAIIEYDNRDVKPNGLKYIHLSPSSRPINMIPRIPKNTMKCEDKKIKRMCFSTSILRATGAIACQNTMYVHTPAVEPQYILKSNEIKDKVQDSPNTGEVWILDSHIKTKVVGKIILSNNINDDRFWFPSWTTDNKGTNQCTYFKDYIFEYFKPISHIETYYFCYYPLTENDIKNGYVDYSINEDFDFKLLHTSLESLQQFLISNRAFSTYTGFIKIPCSLTNLKTNDFYFLVDKINKNKNQAMYIFKDSPSYNFSFNKEDVRTFKQESKFEALYHFILNEDINYNTFAKQYLTIINESIEDDIQVKTIEQSSQLNTIVKQYYNQYYKLNDINTFYNYLNQDLKNFAYCRAEFIDIVSSPKVNYIIAFKAGHLVGLLKYWHISSETFPCVGYIDVNKNFKHQGIGTLLLEKTFKHHINKHPNEPLLFTNFSEEGQSYIKSTVLKLSKKFNVDVFVIDDVRRYWEDDLLKDNESFNFRDQYIYQFNVPESIKKLVSDRMNKNEQCE